MCISTVLDRKKGGYEQTAYCNNEAARVIEDTLADNTETETLDNCTLAVN